MEYAKLLEKYLFGPGMSGFNRPEARRWLTDFAHWLDVQETARLQNELEKARAEGRSKERQETKTLTRRATKR